MQQQRVDGLVVRLVFQTPPFIPPAPSQNSSPYIQELDTLSLKKIASEVGREWKMLSRYLGLDETTIDSIHRANFGDLQEAALQALLK